MKRIPPWWISTHEVSAVLVWAVFVCVESFVQYSPICVDHLVQYSSVYVESLVQYSPICVEHLVQYSLICMDHLVQYSPICVDHLVQYSPACVERLVRYTRICVEDLFNIPRSVYNILFSTPRSAWTTLFNIPRPVWTILFSTLLPVAKHDLILLLVPLIASGLDNLNRLALTVTKTAHSLFSPSLLFRPVILNSKALLVPSTCPLRTEGDKLNKSYKRTHQKAVPRWNQFSSVALARERITTEERSLFLKALLILFAPFADSLDTRSVNTGHPCARPSHVHLFSFTK